MKSDERQLLHMEPNIHRNNTTTRSPSNTNTNNIPIRLLRKRMERKTRKGKKMKKEKSVWTMTPAELTYFLKLMIKKN